MPEFSSDFESTFLVKLEEIREALGMTEEQIEIAIRSISYDPNKTPCELILTNIIKYKIQSSISPVEQALWNKIFWFRTETFHYGMYRILNFQLKKKEEKLEDLDSMFVWKNKDLVDKFMSPDNKLYSDINSLFSICPIQLKIR